MTLSLTERYILCSCHCETVRLWWRTQHVTAVDECGRYAPQLCSRILGLVGLFFGSVMNFFRNRLVVLCLVLLGTLLLYLLLPAIRQGSMEPFLNVQRMGLAGGSLAPSANITVHARQLSGDLPLFFRETVPSDGTGRIKMHSCCIPGSSPLPHVGKNSTWLLFILQTIADQAGYVADSHCKSNITPWRGNKPGGFGNSPYLDTVKTDENRAEMLLQFMEKLDVKEPVVVSPSMSGRFSLPLLILHSSRLKGYIPIAPVGTKAYSVEQYKRIQTPTLIVYGEMDSNLGAQSLDSLSNLPQHSVVKIKGAKHACYLDKPKEFHQALLDFLNKLR
ncbi:ABHEA protein, partial [Polypterus senegalus]|nr:ABHEA protein [Polypterus senegalus]